MRIESYLPIFPGFYETLFAPDEESYIEEGKSWEDYDWNYPQYHDRVAKACVSWVENELKDLGIKVEFQSVYSPTYYNYGNDSINVLYRVKSYTIIREYIDENIEQFQAYLDENYKGYPGFIPSHSRDVEEWKKEISDTHKFGSILNFILNNELEDAHASMYDGVVSEMFVEGELKVLE